MQDFLALLDTVPGQVTLEVMARKSGRSQAFLRGEMAVNAPLAAYFVQVVRQAMAEVPA